MESSLGPASPQRRSRRFRREGESEEGTCSYLDGVGDGEGRGARNNRPNALKLNFNSRTNVRGGGARRLSASARGGEHSEGKMFP